MGSAWRQALLSWRGLAEGGCRAGASRCERQWTIAKVGVAKVDASVKSFFSLPWAGGGASETSGDKMLYARSSRVSRSCESRVVRASLTLPHPCALVFLSLLFKPRAPTLYWFELLSKTLSSAEAPGAAGVGVCALAVLAGHPWSARRGRARSLGVSEECGLRIARSISFGAGNLAGKPRAPKHWCHCQNSVLSNLPLQPRAPALRAKRLTPLHRTVGFGHYDPGYQ